MGLTFNEYFRDQLDSKGLLPEMVDKVMPLIMESEPLRSTMGDRWNQQIDGYPPMVVQLAYRMAWAVVYKWVSENHPMAWFRPIFAPGAETCDDFPAFVTKFWVENTPESEQEASLVKVADYKIDVECNVALVSDPAVSEDGIPIAANALTEGSVNSHYSSKHLAKGN